MTDRFLLLNPQVIIYVWIPLAAAGAAVFGIIRSRKIISSQFASASASGLWNTRRKFILLSVVTAALLLTVFAAARPSWRQTESTVSRKGRDVVFVIDVSRSMLAEDLYPDRLSRAKLAVIDALSVIDGDRVGLVAFAGNAVVKCPLTLDYSFFRQSVEQLSVDSVSVGGSMIGDALRKTMTDVLQSGSGGYRDIILITDGEDQQSYPEKAAGTLGENNIRLIAIGLGDEDVGRRIPVTDANGNRAFLTYQGQEVWSRLDAATLRRMTAATPGGRYLNVSTGAFDMGEIYSELIKSRESRYTDTEETVEHEEDFQYFLLPAVILILVYMCFRYLPVRRQAA